MKRETYCWFCGEKMIWGGDDSYEDHGIEGDGIVANLSCPLCDAVAFFHSKERKTNENDNG